MLVSAQLAENIIKQHALFTDYERYHMLSYTVKCVLNMIPVDTGATYFEKDFIDKQQRMDLFKPKELLNGQSLCDFNIQSPQIIGIKLTEKNYDVTAPSLLEEILTNKKDVLELLRKKHVQRNSSQIYHDLQLLTPIGRCFVLSSGDTVFKSAAKLMIQHLLTENTLYNQMLMMKLMFYVVKQADDLVVFADFFKDQRENEDIYGRSLDSKEDQEPKLA